MSMKTSGSCDGSRPSSWSLLSLLASLARATAFRPWRLELLPLALFDPPDVRLLAGIITPSAGTRAAVFPVPPRLNPATYATPDHAENADASKLLARTLRAFGLGGQEPVEEGAVARQSDTEILRRDVVAALPLRF